jgi:uncharacterized damage-inducible protein DinB
MTEIQRICDLLQSIWHGPSWHGPALWEVIEGITAEQAVRRDVKGAHTMRELAAHVAAWQVAAVRGIQTGDATLAGAEDFPEVSWAETLERLRASEQRVMETVSSLTDTDLERRVRGEQSEFPMRTMIYGLMHHALYHAGQIQLLKRAYAQ